VRTNCNSLKQGDTVALGTSPLASSEMGEFPLAWLYEDAPVPGARTVYTVAEVRSADDACNAELTRIDGAVRDDTANSVVYRIPPFT
jgi:hypothetical protein